MFADVRLRRYVMESRTPFAKLAQEYEQRRGQKRKHDDDKARRSYFAALADGSPQAKTETLLEKANAHFKEVGESEISEPTARRWREHYLLNKSDFVSGMTFSGLRWLPVRHLACLSTYKACRRHDLAWYSEWLRVVVIAMCSFGFLCCV